MKTRNIQTTILAAAITAAGAVSCSTGKTIKAAGRIITTEVSASAFDKVDVSSVFKVEITTGNDYSVSVSGAENIVPLVETEISGNALVIKSKDPSAHIEYSDETQVVHITITMPALTSVSASDQSGVSITGNTAPVFNATASGQASITFHRPLHLSSISASASGQAHISFKNIDADQRTALSCSGQSAIRCGNLHTGTLSCIATGQASANATAFYADNASIATSGQASVLSETLESRSATLTASGQSRIAIKESIGATNTSTSGQAEISIGNRK